MKRLKKFESDFQKYLRLRKVLRIIEAIALLVVISFLLVSGDGIKGIIACSCAILIVPESFLAVYRSGLKGAIKNHILLAEEDIKFYSEMKSEFEKMKAEIIALGKNKSDTEELKQLIWKEEMGTGWLSIKIKKFGKECNEAQQIIEYLEPIRKRLVIF